MKNQIMAMIGCVAVLVFGFTAGARTFDFKQLKSTGSKGSAEYWWQGTEKSKSSWFQVKVGSASKIDDTSTMEIRAATVLKSVKDRKSGINDVVTFEFDPINKGSAIFFMVASGAAFSREHDSYWYGNVNTGWQLAGCIIEIWQKGKVVKHWSNVTGTVGKTKLTDDIKALRINRDGRPSAGDRFYESRSFDNATEIYSVDKNGERVDIDDVLKPFREAEDGAGAASKDGDVPAVKASMKNTVAQKLQSCDFLLNGKFKKDAKFYLCLFSASWCPPCRREMPRIAKTYAETLKNDPDIELIHFSRDQNDEKAMAWAKEHDEKFPVVKPKGGNPLDLHARGIPHLFIVKADGTLVEEGHPMRIFNEEKFRELKGGGVTDVVKPQDDKAGSSKTEGVENVTTDGGLFTLTGPYGIRLTADPGCEKGAEYLMKRLVGHYLPQAKEFYGDPFLGEKPSRVYRIDVRMNDGLGNSQYTGPSYSPGTGRWTIGLAKGAERYEMSLDYLASSVLTLCEEPKWVSFVFYVNRFVEAKAKGIDATPRLKEDIRRGLEEEDGDGKNSWYRAHAPLWAALEDLRAKHPKLILDYCKLKNKRFAEGKLPKKLSLDQMAALLSEVAGADASALFKKYGVKPK